jgi:hypothetical protein
MKVLGTTRSWAIATDNRHETLGAQGFTVTDPAGVVVLALDGNLTADDRDYAYPDHPRYGPARQAPAEHPNPQGSPMLGYLHAPSEQVPCGA